MALTVNNYTGFETQGLEEASASTGSLAFTDKVMTGGGTLSSASGNPEYTLPWITRGVTDAGGKYIFGLRFFKEGNNAQVIVNVHDDIDSPILTLRLSGTGFLELEDAVGSNLDTSASALVDNQTYYIEVYADLNNASGDWEWFIDKISEGSNSGADFTDGNAFASATSGLLLRVPTTSGANFHIDDVYILSGATAASERLGPAEIYAKQGAQIGVTPDTSALADTDLDEARWELASETPLIEQAQGTASAGYTGGAAAGVVYAHGAGDKLGPNKDDRFLGGTILAIKGIVRAGRGGGGATDQFMEIGNDGGAASDILQSADLDLANGAYTTEEFLTETAAALPTITEHAAIGMSKNGGGQDLDIAEMWLMILVARNVPQLDNLSQAQSPDQNSFVGPFED